MNRTTLASLMIFALAACGNEPQGKTTTKLDAVEVQPGTISDSMIILDNAGGDGTAVDNNVPDDDRAKSTAKKDTESSDENASSDATSDEEAKPASVPETKSPAPAAPKKPVGE